MFYKKLILPTANDNDYGVRKKNLRRRDHEKDERQINESTDKRIETFCQRNSM